MRRELLTIQEAADHLARNVHYVRRLVADREIAFHKVGHLLRFDVRDLDAHLWLGVWSEVVVLGPEAVVQPAPGAPKGAQGRSGNRAPRSRVEGLPYWPTGAALSVAPFRIAVRRRPWSHVIYETFFEEHHYLPGGLPRAARSLVAFLPGGQLAAFGSSLPQMGEAGVWRECRLVVLPEFRGLGLGMAVSEWVAQNHRRAGERFRSVTENRYLGAMRDQSASWRATSWNGRSRSPEHQHSDGHRTGVVLYAHEYVGPT